jgi:hypothetical protein
VSETADDDFLDEVLVGGDYQDQLRRIAEASGDPGELGGARKRKTVPDPRDYEPEEEDEEEDLVSTLLTGGYDFQVQTPSGATLPVLTQSEVDYYEDRASRYLRDHKFTSVTDLQDLDRVLSTELLLHRYDIWLALGADYFGQAVAERDLLRYMKELSATLQATKKSMGLDKATRDKDVGADFVSWLDDVKRRAKAFGIMRNKQFETALVLFHELMGKVQLYENCDAVERQELGLSPDELVQWMQRDLFPRFNAIDEHFRQSGPEAQQMWIGDM